MAFCILCGQPCEKGGGEIELRTKRYVCKNCVASREERITQLKSQISNLEYSKMRLVKKQKNRGKKQEYLGGALGVIGLFAVLSSLGSKKGLLYFVLSLILLILAFAILGIIFRCYNSVLKKREESEENEINIELTKLNHQSNTEIPKDKHELSGIYEQYWKNPPDWIERSYKVYKRNGFRCSHCGKEKTHRSRSQFHVHHIIPRARSEGNHSIENLILLCDNCHSKIDIPGHQLIRPKGRRKNPNGGI